MVDRGSLATWQNTGGKTAAERAHDQVQSLLTAYQPRPLPDDVRRALRDITEHAARRFGMDHLPPLPDDICHLTAENAEDAEIY